MSASRPSSGPVSPRPGRSRAHSISSDRQSTVAHHNLTAPPASVSPEACYIATSAACQIVTNDHDSHALAWYDQNDIEPSDQNVIVADSALHLVNGFLDQLLFNFLQVSRATTLTNLRPAVSEVLKPKLAKDTIANADEELREYLGGADEDEYVQPQAQGYSSSRGWDLELVWKRIRLRCMVYSSLGDLEEEDEDMYMEQEHLEIGVDEQIDDVISPAVAIFLTSVIEYMGELVLTVAGQAAYHRIRSKMEKELREGIRQPGDVADSIIVDEMDMERVALDRTLGRLWRAWKKRLRGPVGEMPRPYSRQSAGGHQRHDSLSHDSMTSPKIGTLSDAASDYRRSQDPKGQTIVEDVQPADIPLPMGLKDIDEIEVPGLVTHSDDEDDDFDDEDYDVVPSARPHSVYISNARAVIQNGLPTPNRSKVTTPVLSRKRSNSLPLVSIGPFFSKSNSNSTTQQQLASNIEDQEINEEISAEEAEEEGQEEHESAATAAVPRKLATNGQNNEAPEVLPKSLKRKAIVPRPATATAIDEEQWDSDFVEEATYEKAEVITTSRVSVSSASSPTRSDTDLRPDHKRNSSVHSARIIDVAGPKSPVGSRATSFEARDLRRSLSNEAAPHAIREEQQSKPRAPTSVPSPSGMSEAWAPVERVRRLRDAPSPPVTDSDSDADNRTKQGKRVAELTKQFQVIRAGDSSDDGTPVPDARAYSVPLKRSSNSNKKQEQEQEQELRFPMPPENQNQRPIKVSAFPMDTRNSDAARKAAAAAARPPVQQKVVVAAPIEKRSTPATIEKKSTPATLEKLRTRDLEANSELAPPPPRPHHTPTSSISSLTSRFRPRRTSEDNSSTSRSESVARNFEELIQSNQTITYTLTPETMRNLDSPIVAQFPTTIEEARSPLMARTSPIVPSERAEPPVAAYRSAGIHSTIPEEEHHHQSPSGPIPRNTSSGFGMATNNNRSTSGGPQARDARVPIDSTTDFAEFIKATGPAPNDYRTNSARNISSPVSPVGKNMDGRRVSSSSNANANNRSRYQAREAAVDVGNENQDLVDFIRQGPPIAATNHRIPRHIAPFRSTMDSEELSGVIGGKAVDASIPDIRYSQSSTNATDNSMQSSMNSNTALLKSQQQQQHASAKLNRMYEEPDMMMPQKKTSRIRDPYAIDYSDEEDEELFGEYPPKPKSGPVIRKEESLAEFLRNYDPPSEAAPMTSSSDSRAPKKKASAPSLIGRFGRGAKEPPTSPVKPEPPLPRVLSPVQQRPIHTSSGASTTGRGYIPIQVNIPPGYGKYGPLDDTPTNNRPRGSSMISNRKVPMKKFEPREAAGSNANTETAELAAFLRNSRPPSNPMDNRPVMKQPQEESNGLSRMFRRKKTAA